MTLIQVGTKDEATIVKTLQPQYGGKIDITDYIQETGHSERLMGLNASKHRRSVGKTKPVKQKNAA